MYKGTPLPEKVDINNKILRIYSRQMQYYQQTEQKTQNDNQKRGPETTVIKTTPTESCGRCGAELLREFPLTRVC
jgi:hypothetical protein